MIGCGVLSPLTAPGPSVCTADVVHHCQDDRSLQRWKMKVEFSGWAKSYFAYEKRMYHFVLKICCRGEKEREILHVEVHRGQKRMSEFLLGHSPPILGQVLSLTRGLCHLALMVS